jgi:hypothetical protein
MVAPLVTRAILYLSDEEILYRLILTSYEVIPISDISDYSYSSNR